MTKIDKTKYCKRKTECLEKSIDVDNLEYSDISELEHSRWGPDELLAISLSRGNNPLYGDIEDVITKYRNWFVCLRHFKLLNIITLSRGCDSRFGLIEDAIKKRKLRNNLNFLIMLSLSRGSMEIDEIDIDNIEKYVDL